MSVSKWTVFSGAPIVTNSGLCLFPATIVPPFFFLYQGPGTAELHVNVLMSKSIGSFPTGRGDRASNYLLDLSLIQLATARSFRSARGYGVLHNTT